MKIGLRESLETDFMSMIKKIFPFFIVFALFLSSGSSDDEKGIAVRTELIVHLKSCLVCLHNVFISSERSYRHEHGRARAVEVGNDGSRDGESVRREDELVCPSVVRVHLVVCGGIGLKAADCGDSDSEYLMA